MAVFFVLFINKNLAVRFSAYILFFLMGIFTPVSAQYHFPFYAPLFLLGILIFQYKKNIIGFFELIMVFVPALVYVLNTQGLEVMCVCAFTALIILYFQNMEIPVLNKLGKFSYSVYLIHPIIGLGLINILSHYATEAWQKAGIILLGIAVTFLASFLMYVMVEKPSKTWSSKIKL
jgi:peptidoglycan/LPS O-acetylase OafA/YrhL